MKHFYWTNTSRLCSRSYAEGVQFFSFCGTESADYQCSRGGIFFSLCIYLYICILCHLTILHHATVLVTLRFAVELVSICLAEAGFVGHTQSGGGIKGPDSWLSCAGLRCHGQTAHSCRDATRNHIKSSYLQLVSPHWPVVYKSYKTPR